MKINILRGIQSNEFTGEGEDANGPFEIEGDTDGLVVTFVKSYHEGHRWQYSGILLPWALVGVCRVTEVEIEPDDVFSLWPAE